MSSLRKLRDSSCQQFLCPEGSNKGRPLLVEHDRSFGPKSTLVASTAGSDKKDAKEQTSAAKSTVKADSTMEEDIESGTASEQMKSIMDTTLPRL